MNYFPSKLVYHVRSGRGKDQMDAKKLLDALVGAGSAPASADSTGVRPQPLQDMLGVFGSGKADIGAVLGRILSETVGGLRDLGRDTNVLRKPAETSSIGQPEHDPFEVVIEKVRAMVGGQGLPKGAIIGLGGLLFGTRSGRSLAGQLARLGGLALISGLVYRAYKKSQGEGEAAGDLDPAKATDADAILFIRAMVAAMSADGHIDDNERARIVNALRQAGVGGEEAGWLEREIAKPATVEDLVALATSPEKAAQVYAAARLAMEPDTAQERDFLARLATAMKLDSQIKREVDEGAAGLKEPAGPAHSA
jgi:uncharacterized membrane protein YebE (DUF533 family)